MQANAALFHKFHLNLKEGLKERGYFMGAEAELEFSTAFYAVLAELALDGTGQEGQFNTGQSTTKRGPQKGSAAARARAQKAVATRKANKEKKGEANASPASNQEPS